MRTAPDLADNPRIDWLGQEEAAVATRRGRADLPSKLEHG